MHVIGKVWSYGREYEMRSGGKARDLVLQPATMTIVNESCLSFFGFMIDTIRSTGIDFKNWTLCKDSPGGFINNEHQYHMDKPILSTPPPYKEITDTKNKQLIVTALQHEIDHLNGILIFDHKAIHTIKGENVGRNELCPCGSGKKYKRCCMNG